MDIITAIVITLFSVYGLACIITEWTKILTSDLKQKNGNAFVVMTVKNCQEDIEGIVRSTAWKMLSKNNNFASDLIVIDTGSQDDTLKILSKLETEYEFLHTMTKESCIDMLSKLD